MRRRGVGKLLVGLHVRARLSRGPIGLLLVLTLAAGSRAEDRPPEPHPLDPLTAVEYRTVFRTLDAAGHAEDTTFYPLIQLAEPDKALVKAWRPGRAVKSATSGGKPGAEKSGPGLLEEKGDFKGLDFFEKEKK